MPKRIICDTPRSLRGSQHGPALCKMVWIWHGHRAIMQVRHWPILKNSQKTLRAAATQPVWPSLAVHVVFLFLFCLSPLLFFFFHMKCKTKDISLFIPFKGYLDWVLNSPYFDFKLPLFLLRLLNHSGVFFSGLSVFASLPLPLSPLFLNMSGLSALQQRAVSSRTSQGTTKLLV